MLSALLVLESPNTKTNSFVCANTLGNKALSDSDSKAYSFHIWCERAQKIYICGGLLLKD